MKVALESTVITHGLPYPQNVETALSMENIVRENSGVPVTIGVLAGKIKIGMTADEIERMAKEENVFKAGVRELPIMLAQKCWASTTVSATARLAYLNKIHVFATGGIGGVHPGPWDVSMDLMELSRTPIVVVSAGPKAILDLPGTYEILETIGVTVVGYQVDEMPMGKRIGIMIMVMAEGSMKLPAMSSRMLTTIRKPQAGRPHPTMVSEIGRASCRERV